MKIKYKKMIFIAGMCVMGIGMAGYSGTVIKNKRSIPVDNFNNGQESASLKHLQQADVLTSDDSKTASQNNTVSVQSVNPLEKDAYADINRLFEKYYAAKLKNKADSFKPLVNDVRLLDLKDNARRTKYIEKYQNIACYTKKGLEEGNYIVYVYHDIKFKGIKTLVPGLDRFFVKTDNKNKYIYFGKIDNKTEKYIKETDESEDVINLVYEVNKKCDLAAAKDSSLNKFKAKLEESYQNLSN